MISKTNKPKIFLTIIVSLILAIYSYFFTQNKGAIEIEDQKLINQKKNLNNIPNITKFTDVIYKTSDIKKRDYITKGKEAYFSKKEPDLINLSIVNSFTTLKDGSVLNVISDQAVYYKSTKNIKYSKNIKITNKEGIITAEVANFFANKNKITLEGNVIFKNNNNIIKGDIAELDTTTNNLKILMKKKTEKVYGKREQK